MELSKAINHSYTPVVLLQTIQGKQIVFIDPELIHNNYVTHCTSMCCQIY